MNLSVFTQSIDQNHVYFCDSFCILLLRAGSRGDSIWEISRLSCVLGLLGFDPD